MKDHQDLADHPDLGVQGDLPVMGGLRGEMRMSGGPPRGDLGGVAGGLGGVLDHRGEALDHLGEASDPLPEALGRPSEEASDPREEALGPRPSDPEGDLTLAPAALHLAGTQAGAPRWALHTAGLQACRPGAQDLDLWGQEGLGGRPESGDHQEDLAALGPGDLLASGAQVDLLEGQGGRLTSIELVARARRRSRPPRRPRPRRSTSAGRSGWRRRPMAGRVTTTTPRPGPPSGPSPRARVSRS